MSYQQGQNINQYIPNYVTRSDYLPTPGSWRALTPKHPSWYALSYLQLSQYEE